MLLFMMVASGLQWYMFRYVYLFTCSAEIQLLRYHFDTMILYGFYFKFDILYHNLLWSLLAGILQGQAQEALRCRLKTY